MKIASHKTLVSADARNVWHKLLDWPTWPTWDHGMQSVQFDGPIDAGSVGRLKLKNGPVVTLHIDSVEEGRNYSDHFRLLGTRFIFDHRIEEAGPGTTRLTFEVFAEGGTAFIFGPLLSCQMQAFLKKAAANFTLDCQRP